MKYIISESKLEGAIYEYLNEIFPVDEINWQHPWAYNEDGEEDDGEGEDENRIQFYIGDYEDGENDCFKWYGCEYFNPDSFARDVCPTVTIDGLYESRLNSYFGNTWQEPFKKWFIKNFDLPCKTVEWM